MPKRGRFPLFILGLAVIILGSVAANAEKVGTSSIAGVVAVGFVLLVLSVLIR
jgi:hypothetical protein